MAKGVAHPGAELRLGIGIMVIDPQTKLEGGAIIGAAEDGSIGRIGKSGLYLLLHIDKMGGG